MEENESLDYKKASINELVSFFSKLAVEELMLQGGRGLRGAIREAIWAGMAMQKEQGK